MPEPCAHPADVELARRLVLEHGWNATAYQILNPGIELWFAARRDAVVGFVRRRRTRVVAGAPIAASERLAEVAAEFEADAAARCQRVCYFAAEARFLATPRAASRYARVLLGAQPVWHPAALLAAFARHPSLRAQLHRARNKGVRIRELDADSAQADAGLARCLREWLATRGLPTLHFLVEPRTLERVLDRRVFVAERGGEKIAFLVASPIPCRNGWLIEQIVRGAGACNGSSELLLAASARALAQANAEHLTLGLAPLAVHGAPADYVLEPWVRWLFAWLRAHGRRFYDFDGLEAFKAKFQPERWEPVFALAPSARITPGTLWAIAGAFGKTSPLLLGLRALARALGSEVRRAGRRIARR